jgi:hypothetical protein
VKSGSLNTKNSIILGNYTVTEYLELRSFSGPVFANVNMHNIDKRIPTRLSVGTHSALVYANVSLTSNETRGGDFAIDASNNNSPLRVQLPVAPIDHVLFLSARSYGASIRVDLPPTYEGAFLLSSSLRPNMKVAEDLGDPEGEGRIRQITLDNTGHDIAGNITWAGVEREGSVEITSQTLDATLNL